MLFRLILKVGIVVTLLGLIIGIAVILFRLIIVRQFAFGIDALRHAGRILFVMIGISGRSIEHRRLGQGGPVHQILRLLQYTHRDHGGRTRVHARS